MALDVGVTLITQAGSMVASRANAKAAAAADPKARTYSVTLAVEWPGFKGEGLSGRVVQHAGADGSGALFFARRPADAPVIHFGGPLHITFESDPPLLKLRRESDTCLIVGTPGRGPGTFAALFYEGVIPEGAVAVADAEFPAAREGDPPIRQRYELKERC